VVEFRFNRTAYAEDGVPGGARSICGEGAYHEFVAL
jgi:hypothetical protein